MIGRGCIWKALAAERQRAVRPGERRSCMTQGADRSGLTTTGGRWA